MHTTTIDVKLRKKDEFYSQYNDGKLSKDLAKYLKQECYGEDVNNKIVINIYHKFSLTKKEKDSMIDIIRHNYGMLIQDEEYYLFRNQAMEIILFGGGILFLFVYYLFKRIEVFSEIMLILGWLAIWESTYSFIFNGLSLKTKIKRLKELTKAKINFIQEK